MRPWRRDCRRFQARGIGKTPGQDMGGFLEAGKGGCFLGGCFVHFASLSNDFWPEMKRLSLNCLCGCLGSGWRAWAEECVYQPDVST